jgi:hypothetical protein
MRVSEVSVSASYREVAVWRYGHAEEWGKLGWQNGHFTAFRQEDEWAEEPKQGSCRRRNETRGRDVDWSAVTECANGEFVGRRNGVQFEVLGYD